MRNFVYRFLLWSHRWLGITIGLHFVLLGLSGSYLVYADELDAFFKPHLMKSAGESQPFDLEKAVAAAQAGLLINTPPIRVQIAPLSSRFNHKLTFNIPEGEQKRRFFTAYIDSSNFEYKGTENFRKTVRGFLFIFHHDLFSGGTGRTIIGVSGILSMILLLGGLYLWWPRGSRTFKKALSYTSRKNLLGLNIELHKLSGFYSLILMIVVTFSGIYLARPDWFIDRESQGRPAQMLFADLQKNLHVGHFWGQLGLFLVFLSGILPFFFYLTGFYIWLKKRSQRLK